ncbi:MAG: YitT family protein [Clostridia bacterium]|nr:YitT family protein [Clostridia bacterium]
MKKKIGTYIYDVFLYIIGTAISAVAINFFLSANEISPGGLAGISTALNFIFGIPSGFVLFILNVPVLIIGYKKLGAFFILKTSFAAISLSIMLDITAKLLPVIIMDKIIASVFGGIILGVGMSLVMLRGATTGGVDIIAKLINKKFSHLSIGKIILLFDGIVIVFASVAYKNIESALYSVIAMYASTKIIDIMIYGGDMGKIVYAVTKKEDDIALRINERLERGVTLIPAYGSYTGESKTMLMCTVRRHEVAAVCSIIREIDSKAFIVICEAGEIIGEGFKIK